MSYPVDNFGNCTECGGGIEGSIDHMPSCKYMEITDDTTMLGVRALAFALLLCRSKAEALKVLRYFAMPKSPVPTSPEPDDQSDGASPHWR